jgi:hypothetical protein
MLALCFLVVEAVGSERRVPPIYEAPEGWRSALVGGVNWARAREFAKIMREYERRLRMLGDTSEPEGELKLLFMQVDEGGEWFYFEFDLDSCKVQIWKDTKILLVMKSGETVASQAIVALSEDRNVLVDNREGPFLVTQRTFGYRVLGGRRVPQVFAKFPAGVDRKEVESFSFVGAGCQN